MSSVDPPVPPIAPASPEAPGWASRGLLGWVATSNPFYVVSAGLFLFGLRISFGAQERESDAWALTTGLAGYTLLLASAALLLVRFAGVWNDVRTVLLLVVLMFLATSVTFDELLALDPARGSQLYLGGLAFALIVTEGLLRGIRLRLPMGFRIPYYLALALFFLYPIALTPFLREPRSEQLMWGLFGFSPAAGLIFLTLIPAIRRGPNYVRNNGSPWPWPFYPWSLFVFLAFAVVGRSFLLCWSLHLLAADHLNQLIFEPYFLVLFGLSLTILLLEIGLVSRNRTVMRLALLFPVGLVVMAGIGHRSDAIAAEFLSIFTARLGGSPLYLTLILAGAFYASAWIRHVPLATEGLTLALVALAYIGPETQSLETVAPVGVSPLLAAAILQIALGIWRRDGWRILAVGIASCPWAGLFVARGYVALRAKIAGLDYLVLSLALFPIAVLVSLAKAGVLGRWIESRRPR